MTQQQEIDTYKLISDLAALAVRYNISTARLSEFCVSLAPNISTEASKRIIEKNRRLSVPDRNKLIVKKNLDGTTRRQLSEEFSLGMGSIADIILGIKRDILRKVYGQGVSVEEIALIYDVSPNQILEMVRKDLSYERDQLAESIINGDLSPENRYFELNRLRGMTRFLNDADTTFFVMREVFTDIVDQVTLNNAVNSSRTIIWAVEPALIVFSDGSWIVVSIEEAYEVARSINVLKPYGNFDGRRVNWVGHITGEPIWVQAES